MSFLKKMSLVLASAFTIYSCTIGPTVPVAQAQSVTVSFQPTGYIMDLGDGWVLYFNADYKLIGFDSPYGCYTF